MSKDEKSLWLFFETCIVDRNGKVSTVHMNKDDFEIAKRWDEEGLIQFRRIPFKEIEKKQLYASTHTVAFSEKAFDRAYQCRKERALRHNRWENKKEE